MALFELEPGDEEFLDECPVCGKGYMIPTYGHWYQCSECGVEATEEEGVLWWDKSVKFKE